MPDRRWSRGDDPVALLRLACLGVTNGLAFPRLLPMGGRDQAMAVSRAATGVSTATLRQTNGEEIALPASPVAVLQAIAGQLSQGDGVTVLATEVRLTPAEVGELLACRGRSSPDQWMPGRFPPNTCSVAGIGSCG